MLSASKYSTTFLIDRSAISVTKEVLLRSGAQIRPDAITFKTYTLF